MKMVEEWKKAAEVSRELEYKALECSPLMFFHVSPPLKDHLWFCSYFTSTEKMVTVLPVDFL